MSKGTLDHDTLQAVGVLARAVEQARVPGVLEFRLLSGALNRTLESRSEQDLRDSERIFQTIDRDYRARIVQKADTLARAEASAARGEAAAVPPPGGGLGKAMRSATGFLSALNGVRAAVTPRSAKAEGADSRGTAKARLMAAVDERRMADLRADSMADSRADSRAALRAGLSADSKLRTA